MKRPAESVLIEMRQSSRAGILADIGEQANACIAEQFEKTLEGVR